MTAKQAKKWGGVPNCQTAKLKWLLGTYPQDPVSTGPVVTEFGQFGSLVCLSSLVEKTPRPLNCQTASLAPHTAKLTEAGQ